MCFFLLHINAGYRAARRKEGKRGRGDRAEREEVSFRHFFVKRLLKSQRPLNFSLSLLDTSHDRGLSGSGGRSNSLVVEETSTCGSTASSGLLEGVTQCVSGHGEVVQVGHTGLAPVGFERRVSRKREEVEKG